MQKKFVAVLMGGPSSEHDVSIKSGLNVVRHMNAAHYEPMPVFIDKRGYWLFPEKDESPLPESEALLALRARGVAAVFLALHGEYGEDGTVQSALRAAGVPFTGSHAHPSALAMHKVLAARELYRAGLRVPEHYELSPIEWRNKPQEVLKTLFNRFGRHMVIKPTNRGSSVGVTLVNIKGNDLAPLRHAVELALSTSKHVIAEEYIRGREMTCAVLDILGHPSALLPTEIIPVSSSFFDYRAKYETGASREVTPPSDMSPKLIKKIEGVALTAHKALGLRGVSRADMILSPGGTLTVLEVNTLPGLTDTSLLPQAAAACGITFTKLIDLLLEDALA